MSLSLTNPLDHPSNSGRDDSMIDIDEMEKLMEHMVSGVTAVAQRAALAAIAGLQDCVKEMGEEYEKRRRVIHEGLNEISERT